MTVPFVALESARLAYAGGSVLALDGVDLAIAEGEFAAVVGPSGCGKSTLMKLVTGLIRASEGSVTVAGREVTGPLKIVGMAFQNPTLLPWRRTIDNVLLPMQIVEPHRRRFRQNRAEYKKAAEALLATVGLAGFGERRPWGSWLEVKTNAPDLYDRDFDRIRASSRPDLRIFMSSVTDPWLPQEKRHRVTRGILERMREILAQILRPRGEPLGVVDHAAPLGGEAGEMLAALDQHHTELVFQVAVANEEARSFEVIARLGLRVAGPCQFTAEEPLFGGIAQAADAQPGAGRPETGKELRHRPGATDRHHGHAVFRQLSCLEVCQGLDGNPPLGRCRAHPLHAQHSGRVNHDRSHQDQTADQYVHHREPGLRSAGLGCASTLVASHRPARDVPFLRLDGSRGAWPQRGHRSA